MIKTGLKKRGKRSGATFLVRDSQKKHRKSSRNQRMHETQKKTPRIVYACTVWMHILEVRPEICGFIA
jgi:hypothetical protein